MPFDLQPIDILLLVILALAALSGWRRGFAMVLLGYLGLLVGLALGAWAATQAGLLVSADSSVRRLLTAVVVFFLVAAACHAVGNLLGIRVRSLLGGRWTSRADAIGGAVVATVVAAMAMWFVALTLSNVPLSPFSRAVQLLQRAPDDRHLRPPAAGGPGPAAGAARPLGVPARRSPPCARRWSRAPRPRRPGTRRCCGRPTPPSRSRAGAAAGCCSAAASRSPTTWSSPTPTWSPGRAATRWSPTRACGPGQRRLLRPGPRPGPAVGPRPPGQAAAPGHGGGQAGPAGGGDRLPERRPPEGHRGRGRAPDPAGGAATSTPGRAEPPRHLRAPRPGPQGGQRRPGGRPAGPAAGGGVRRLDGRDQTEGYALTNAEVRRALDRSGGDRRPVSVGGCAV